MTVVMRDKGCLASTIGYYLVIVGAVNWGLVGVGQFLGGDWNVVHMALGMLPMWVESAVYVLVGISGVVTFFGCCCKICKACKGEASA